MFLEVVVMESGKVLVDVFDLITLIPHFFEEEEVEASMFSLHILSTTYTSFAYYLLHFDSTASSSSSLCISKIPCTFCEYFFIISLTQFAF